MSLTPYRDTLRVYKANTFSYSFTFEEDGSALDLTPLTNITVRYFNKNNTTFSHSVTGGELTISGAGNNIISGTATDEVMDIAKRSYDMEVIFDNNGAITTYVALDAKVVDAESDNSTTAASFEVSITSATGSIGGQPTVLYAETVEAKNATQAIKDSIEWKGAWAVGTTYTEGQRVKNNGSSFISLQNDNTGNTPVGNDADTWWDLIAEKGDDGTDGTNGTDGDPITYADYTDKNIPSNEDEFVGFDSESSNNPIKMPFSSFGASTPFLPNPDFWDMNPTDGKTTAPSGQAYTTIDGFKTIPINSLNNNFSVFSISFNQEVSTSSSAYTYFRAFVDINNWFEIKISNRNITVTESVAGTVSELYNVNSFDLTTRVYYRPMFLAFYIGSSYNSQISSIPTGEFNNSLPKTSFTASQFTSFGWKVEDDFAPYLSSLAIKSRLIEL